MGSREEIRSGGRQGEGMLHQGPSTEEKGSRPRWRATISM